VPQRTSVESPPVRSNFERLFTPRGVAIIGASNEPSRIGGQPLRSLTQFGYSGGVYPVNPKYPSISDRVCFPEVSAVPDPCDLAIIALPAAHVAKAVEQCGARGIGYAIVFSAGFREVGDKGTALHEELVATARRVGVRLIGPNCQGLLNLRSRVYAGFGSIFQRADLEGGPLAMVTQSGGFGTGVVKLAQIAGIGFNYVVSTGNEADIDALDLLEYLLEQDDVEVLTTYMEGITDGRRLLALGQRALALRKPILVWKVGSSSSGMRAAVSHTANLSSAPELYRAVFREGGFIEVRDVDDLIDAARAFLSRRLPRGKNVGVLTNSGGAGVLLADRCEERGLHLPVPTEGVKQRLRALVPEYGALGNPIDVTAQVSSDPLRMNRVVSILLEDPDFDQVILSRGNASGEFGVKWAHSFVETIHDSDKPVLVHILPDGAEKTLQLLDRHRVAWFPTPGRAVAGAACLREFAVKVARSAARSARTQPRREIEWSRTTGALGEHEAKNVLAAYGIPAVREVLLSPAAVQALTEPPMRFPVALKIESADIAHKTEAGAVRLNIDNLAELKAAARAIETAARDYRPNARIAGILVQEMASGVEIMAGVVNDDVFGPVVALGLGGIFAETLRDVTHRCAPFDIGVAHTMIDELKGRALLDGVRGRPAADVEALADAISRLSLLATDHADHIAEIDINPLFVRPAGEGVVAADALIVLRNGKGMPNE